MGVEHYLHRLSPLHHAPAPLLPTVDLSSATQRMSSTFSAASDEGNAASTQTTPLSSSTSSISNDTLPPNSSSQSTTSSNNPPPSTATMLHRDAYQRSLDSPSESVRYTCRRVVELESLKPRAPHSIPYTHPWPSSPSSTPSPFTSLPCPAPAASLDPSFSHVWVDYDRLRAELDAHPGLYQPSAAPGSWAQWYHYVDVEDEDGWRRTAQYVMVLDSLNFCFWPQPDYEYSQPPPYPPLPSTPLPLQLFPLTLTYPHPSPSSTGDLASSLKRVLLNDPAAFSASRLLSLTESELQAWLQPLSPQQKRAMQSQTTLRTSSGSRRELPPPLVTSITPPSPFVPIPLLPSRTRALNELGGFLAAHHGSLAYDLVKAAPTATHLLTTLVAHLPSFRDHCIHPTSGMQVFFYSQPSPSTLLLSHPPLRCVAADALRCVCREGTDLDRGPVGSVRRRPRPMRLGRRPHPHRLRRLPPAPAHDGPRPAAGGRRPAKGAGAEGGGG